MRESLFYLNKKYKYLHFKKKPLKWRNKIRDREQKLSKLQSSITTSKIEEENIPKLLQ